MRGNILKAFATGFDKLAKFIMKSHGNLNMIWYKTNL